MKKLEKTILEKKTWKKFEKSFEKKIEKKNETKNLNFWKKFAKKIIFLKKFNSNIRFKNFDFTILLYIQKILVLWFEIYSIYSVSDGLVSFLASFVSYFLCGTNILSLPDGRVKRVMGKTGWAKELSS